MTEKYGIYKCNVCGNIVEVVHEGAGEMVCCNVPMEELQEKKSDENLQEKHVPIVTMEGDNKIIRVGSIPHPMLKEHYIMFIEAISSDGKYIKRKYLTPDEAPEMDVQNCDYKHFKARELCNLHGLWVNENLN